MDPEVGLGVAEKRNISYPAENRSMTGRSSCPQRSYYIDNNPVLYWRLRETLRKCNKKQVVNTLSGLFSDECKCRGINNIVNRYENKLLLKAGMHQAPKNEFCCRKQILRNTPLTQHASRV